MLRDLAMPEVKAVGIDGLTWHVPRIDPAHFSVQDFERLIRQSITYRSRQVECTNADGLLPQHLWLDVACIDQEDEKTKMSEIGRQATIFANVETALIWLTQYNTRELEQSVRQFATASA